MVAVFVLGAATLGTVVINVKRNAMKKMSGSMFEDEARRAAAAKERVDGIAKLLEEVNAKANAAEEKLEAAMREKNAIERVLEEMERTKANMKVENMELRDSVTVLKNDLNNVHGTTSIGGAKMARRVGDVSGEESARFLGRSHRVSE
jgi:membrane-associated HD superfamily phosphohydrolase